MINKVAEELSIVSDVKEIVMEALETVQSLTYFATDAHLMAKVVEMRKVLTEMLHWEGGLEVRVGAKKVEKLAKELFDIFLEKSQKVKLTHELGELMRGLQGI